MIPVSIQKGIKHKVSPFFTRLHAKFRVPASITFGPSTDAEELLMAGQSSNSNQLQACQRACSRTEQIG
jgi:hypothetical protein